ncbi:RHS repeat-associated core domain-containing protein [Flavobacterium psychrophilum]|uniref:hypothetical protein n=1 Tax=Flavobacterium psychrophilum TaxID=96345 RepID=UPI000903C262|nr:hypothetical protein [Flavobacterium psychrophilum]ELM3645146.1 hypothetical protein [Flavobacterium psychrophilum]MCB6089636.1 hypothetical protein [Flavobacterium psychrophilum]OJH12243.1 hypothetical protein FPG87_13040 [Flavobacterium psychrophilum]SNA71366.1 hypothetical protein DK095_230002 [Flavobacterium psychrophilum]SNA76536.1 hypothetical protein DK150_390003 [Flavobacterium psychrophilum]
MTSLWLSVDPLAEIKPNFSSFNYCSNNPINNIDPKGLTDYKVDGEVQTINDGHNDVVMTVSRKEFNKLEKKFDKGGGSYERYMNKLSVQNGFTTSGTYADSEATGGTGISITQHKAGGDSYQQWSDSKDDSNLTSGSGIIGYEGSLLSKTEILIRSGAKGASFSELRSVSKTLKGVGKFGKTLGVIGLIATSIEDGTSDKGLTWGTAAKVGIGGALLFASAPVGVGIAVIDLGVGLATGTTITDRIGNYVDEKTK